MFSSLSLLINLFFYRSSSAQMVSPTPLEEIFYTVRGKRTTKLWMSRATQGRRTPMWEAPRKKHALLSREHYRISVWLRVAQTLGFPQPLWSPVKSQGHLTAWLLNLKLEILWILLYICQIQTEQTPEGSSMQYSLWMSAARGLSLSPGLGTPPREGNGNPLHYSCL